MKYTGWHQNDFNAQGYGRWVTWRSADAHSPAVVGAPIRVTGWAPHPTVKGALLAPLPGSVSPGP
jgi:hypothetical protein